MIKQLIDKYKLTQAQAAKVLGVAPPTVTSWIKGEKPMSEPVRILADIYLNSPGMAYARIECVIPTNRK
jgi:predicted transcriptional regulator